MTRHIDHLKYEVSALAPETLRSEIDALFKKLEVACKDNIRALLEIADVDMHETDINEMFVEGKQFGDDYETQSTFKVQMPHEKDLTQTSEIELSESAHNELREKLRNEREVLVGYESFTKAQQARLLYLDAAIDALDSADQEYDELWWNYGWRPFGDDPDPELANRVGLNIFKANPGTTHEELYLTLAGCGMDLSPHLMAYVVLAHGVIPRQYAHQLTGNDLNYTVHVLGQTLFKEVIQKLGVEKQVMKRYNAQVRERKASDRKQAKYRAAQEKQRNRPISPALRKAIEAELAARKLVAEKNELGETPVVDPEVGVLCRAWHSDAGYTHPGQRILDELGKYSKVFQYHEVSHLLTIGQTPVEQ